jgi:hypothetical protein
LSIFVIKITITTSIENKINFQALSRKIAQIPKRKERE